MTTATEEQQRILNDGSRLRVVRAVPGSGKTWLVATRLQQSLQEWTQQDRGIAVLSFTNVARNEIVEHLGYVPGHPHFVGTLDAFLLRYLVGPFFHLLEPEAPRMRLVPGELATVMAEKQQWSSSSANVKDPGSNRVANVFTANFADQDDRGKPVFTAKTLSWESPQRIEGEWARRILLRKEAFWKQSGRVTHSDVAYLSFKLLDASDGHQVLSLLSRRFPAFVVDELQDTGWYMGLVLRRLLADVRYRALLVGDPDQAIFEFSGARPALFADFEALPGATSLPLTATRRCPRVLRRVANHLAGSDEPMSGPSRTGRAVLAHYSDDPRAALAKLLDGAAAKGVPVEILVRNNDERHQLGQAPLPRPKFGSKPLEKLHRGVTSLREGEARKALQLASSCLTKMTFGTDHLDERGLLRCQVDPDLWRSLAVQLLLGSYAVLPGENLYDWCQRAKRLMAALAEEHGLCESESFKAPRKPSDRLADLPVHTEQSPAAVRARTVHQAKGQTHCNTIYFISRPSREARCPSVQWWQPDSEERRIAYVAATRALDTFVLCVHDDVLERLEEHRPGFFCLFERIPLEEVDLFASPGGEAELQEAT